MVTSPHTELESLRRLHAQDQNALLRAADLIARLELVIKGLREKT